MQPQQLAPNTHKPRSPAFPHSQFTIHHFPLDPESCFPPVIRPITKSLNHSIAKFAALLFSRRDGRIPVLLLFRFKPLAPIVDLCNAELFFNSTG